MLDEPPLFGFDVAADGAMTVVEMRRGPDGWRVERTDGPDNADLSRVVARIAGEHSTPPPRTTTGPGFVEIIDEWMDAHSGIMFTLTDEQRALLAATFEKHVAEGTIRLYP